MSLNPSTLRKFTHFPKSGSVLGAFDVKEATINLENNTWFVMFDGDVKRKQAREAMKHFVGKPKHIPLNQKGSSLVCVELVCSEVTSVRSNPNGRVTIAKGHLMFPTVRHNPTAAIDFKHEMRDMITDNPEKSFKKYSYGRLNDKDFLDQLWSFVSWSGESYGWVTRDRKIYHRRASLIMPKIKISKRPDNEVAFYHTHPSKDEPSLTSADDIQFYLDLSFEPGIKHHYTVMRDRIDYFKFKVRNNRLQKYLDMDEARFVADVDAMIDVAEKEVKKDNLDPVDHCFEVTKKVVQKFNQKFKGIASITYKQFVKPDYLPEDVVNPFGEALANPGPINNPSLFREVSPEEFVSARKYAKRQPFLSPHSAKRIRETNTKAYLSTDNLTGYLIDPTGDLQNLFNIGEAGRGALAVRDAISRGAVSVDAFDPFLPKYYAQFGFEEWGRYKWSDDYAPSDWDYSTYGRPDVVFMKLPGVKINPPSGDYPRPEFVVRPEFEIYDNPSAEITPYPDEAATIVYDSPPWTIIRVDDYKALRRYSCILVSHLNITDRDEHFRHGGRTICTAGWKYAKSYENKGQLPMYFVAHNNNAYGMIAHKVRDGNSPWGEFVDGRNKEVDMPRSLLDAMNNVLSAEQAKDGILAHADLYGFLDTWRGRVTLREGAREREEERQRVQLEEEEKRELRERSARNREIAEKERTERQQAAIRETEQRRKERAQLMREAMRHARGNPGPVIPEKYDHRVLNDLKGLDYDWVHYGGDEFAHTTYVHWWMKHYFGPSTRTRPQSLYKLEPIGFDKELRGKTRDYLSTVFANNWTYLDMLYLVGIYHDSGKKVQKDGGPHHSMAAKNMWDDFIADELDVPHAMEEAVSLMFESDIGRRGISEGFFQTLTGDYYGIAVIMQLADIATHHPYMYTSIAEQYRKAGDFSGNVEQFKDWWMRQHVEKLRTFLNKPRKNPKPVPLMVRWRGSYETPISPRLAEALLEAYSQENVEDEDGKKGKKFMATVGSGYLRFNTDNLGLLTGKIPENSVVKAQLGFSTGNLTISFSRKNAPKDAGKEVAQIIYEHVGEILRGAIPDVVIDTEVEGNVQTNPRKMEANVIIISGPSGVGKSTFVRYLKKNLEGAGEPLTVTSRPRRPKERKGIDRHFVTKERFLDMIEDGEFVEWTQQRNGHYYGRRFADFNYKYNIVDVNLRGMRKYKEAFPNAHAIFLKPDVSPKSLLRRILRRGGMTYEEAKSRVRKAKPMIEQAKTMDFDQTSVIHEGRFEEDFAQLLRGIPIANPGKISNWLGTLEQAHSFWAEVLESGQIIRTLRKDADKENTSVVVFWDPVEIDAQTGVEKGRIRWSYMTGDSTDMDILYIQPPQSPLRLDDRGWQSGINANPSRTPEGRKIPKKYLKGLNREEMAIAAKEIDKGYKYDADDPEAYEEWKSDIKAKARGYKTVPSKYKKKFIEMYGPLPEKGKFIDKVAKATKIKKSILQKVYDKGLAAWATGHRVGVAPHQWATGRVYSFVTLGNTVKKGNKKMPDYSLAVEAGLVKDNPPNSLEKDFEWMIDNAYDVRSKEAAGEEVNGKEWWNQQIPWIEERYGTEPLNVSWILPLDTEGFDPSDKSKEFDKDGKVQPLHFLNQLKRIPLTKPTTPERIMQIALNIGQGLAVGVIEERYSIDDFITYDNPRKKRKKKASCPPATQDLELNTKNRDAAVKAEHIQYGPLNLSDKDYWVRYAERWNTTPAVAKKSNCSNCIAFDISPRMKDCMPGKTSDKDGELGYCWMHHFKCHSARSCYTWAKGGPISKDKVSHEWQERAFPSENPPDPFFPGDAVKKYPWLRHADLIQQNAPIFEPYGGPEDYIRRSVQAGSKITPTGHQFANTISSSRHGQREIISLAFTPKVQALYLPFKKDAQSRGFMAIKDHVNMVRFPRIPDWYEKVKGEWLNKVWTIDEMIENGGVCRHLALMSGLLLERAIQEGVLNGKAYYFRGPGHGWIVYTESGRDYIIDAAQNYWGPIEGKEYEVEKDVFILYSDHVNIPTSRPPAQAMRGGLHSQASPELKELLRLNPAGVSLYYNTVLEEFNTRVKHGETKDVLIAKLGDKVVGVIQFGTTPGHLMIDTVWVNSSVRGQGIMDSMMKKLIADHSNYEMHLKPGGQAAETTVNRWGLTPGSHANVAQVSNEDLVRIYQKYGFQQRPSAPYMMDRPIMNPKEGPDLFSYFERWAKLVNMKNKELKAFLDSPLGKTAGLSPQEAKEQGIFSGRVSGRRILKMREKIGLGGPKDYIKGPRHLEEKWEVALNKWTGPSKDYMNGTTDWDWCMRQVRFNTRHGAFPYNHNAEDRKGPLIKKQKTQNKVSRRLLGLWVWGHDPWRWARKHGVERMPKCPDVPWVGMTEKRKYGKVPVVMNPKVKTNPHIPDEFEEYPYESMKREFDDWVANNTSIEYPLFFGSEGKQEQTLKYASAMIQLPEFKKKYPNRKYIKFVLAGDSPFAETLYIIPKKQFTRKVKKWGKKYGAELVKANPHGGAHRVPQKYKGQPMDEHSDLYVNEKEENTIEGLGFKDRATAIKSVNIIKRSGKTHAHKIQAAMAMEQRARFHPNATPGIKAAQKVYAKFIEEMKKKTKSRKNPAPPQPNLNNLDSVRKHVEWIVRPGGDFSGDGIYIFDTRGIFQSSMYQRSPDYHRIIVRDGEPQLNTEWDRKVFAEGEEIEYYPKVVLTEFDSEFQGSLVNPSRHDWVDEEDDEILQMFEW